MKKGLISHLSDIIQCYPGTQSWSFAFWAANFLMHRSSAAISTLIASIWALVASTSALIASTCRCISCEKLRAAALPMMSTFIIQISSTMSSHMKKRQSLSPSYPCHSLGIPRNICPDSEMSLTASGWTLLFHIWTTSQRESLVAGGAAPVLARFAPGPMVLGE